MPPVVQWILGGVIIGLLSVGGCCGLGMWRMGNAIQDAQKAMEQARADAEAERLARTVPVEAEPLLQEFQKDPAAADRKYLGKCLEVTGVVERSGRGRDRVPFVILRGGDEKAKLRIECFFEVMTDVEDAKVRRLGTGQTITVRGEYDGQVSNVQLRECVLVK